MLADPGLKKVYGTYNHATLKAQDYRAIFRDAKNAARDAIKDGSFSKDLANEEAAVADGGEGDAAGPEPAGIVKVEDGTFQDWTSEKGSKINAKLVAVEGDALFVFETKSGKTIRATAAQLSAASVKKARELAGL